MERYKKRRIKRDTGETEEQRRQRERVERRES